MALRSSSPGSTTPPSESTNDSGALGSNTSSRVLPESRDKRVIAGVVAVALLANMAVPWWVATYPLLEKTPFLAGWQMLVVGFGIGELPGLTGFNPIGNFLFGALPVLATFVLAVLWVLRAVSPRAVPLRTTGVWAVFTLLTQLWLLILGWARLNATMGAHPATIGLLIAVMLTVFSAIVAFGWWRRGEKGLWPSRGRFKAADADGEDAESVLGSEIWDADADDSPRVDRNESTSG